MSDDPDRQRVLMTSEEEFRVWVQTPEFREYLARACELHKANDVSGLVALIQEIRANRKGE